MENAYGIGVSNRYALLDDEDPILALKQSENIEDIKAVADKKVKPAKGRAASPPNKEKRPVREEPPTERQDNRRDARPPRNQERRSGENREERGNRRNEDFNNRPPRDDRGDRENQPPSRFNERGGGGDVGSGGMGSFDGGDGGRRLGRGGSRGGRGRGRGRGMGRDREFDRRSGSDRTGIKAMDKKDGGGSHNWGRNDEFEGNDTINQSNVSDDQDWTGDTPVQNGEANQSMNQQPNDEDESGGNVEGDASKTPGDDDATPAPPEPELLTLDEWKAKQEPRNKPKFNLRKPGEGEDVKQWKNTFKLEKVKADSESEEEDDEGEEDADYHHRRQRQVLDIQLTFKDPVRTERRGGRGGGRGGGRWEDGEGGRGGRGGGRWNDGEGGRGGGRRWDDSDAGGRGAPRGGRGGRRGGGGGENWQNRQHQSVPKIDDDNQFPSLP